MLVIDKYNTQRVSELLKVSLGIMNGENGLEITQNVRESK